MPDAAVVRQIAAEIVASTNAGERFKPLRIDDRPLGAEMAYAVQKQVSGQLQAEGAAKIAGYKIGLTNPAMQKMCGVNEPVVGQILSNRIHSSPARVDLGDFIRLGIESELAIRLARPIPPLPAGEHPRQLLPYIDGVAAAFELVDDRSADYASLDASSIIAENGWNRGIVTGALVDCRGLQDLTGLPGALSINGQPAGEGSSSDVMGGPLEVLAWLSRFVGTVGYELNAGHWIMTGAIVPTNFCKAHDVFRFALADLPPIELTLE